MTRRLFASGTLLPHGYEYEIDEIDGGEGGYQWSLFLDGVEWYGGWAKSHTSACRDMHNTADEELDG